MLAATAPLFATAAVPSPEDSAPNVWDSERSDNSCFAVILSTLLVFALVPSSVPMLCSWRISVGFFQSDLHRAVHFLTMHVR